MDTSSKSVEHTPVLLAEVLDALQPQGDDCFVDTTFGRGGHSRAILERLGPDGRLIVLDADPSALATLERDVRLVSACVNFRDLRTAIPPLAEQRPIRGILFDLGISSAQLSDPSLGLSFQSDGPLFMRLDRDQNAMTAATIVNGWSVQDLGVIFRDLGEERHWHRVAAAIVERRRSQRFTTTSELAAVVSRAVGGRRGKRHPATKVFQALRMAVNDELGNLRVALDSACDLLMPGGRLAVITFHSIEDRVVKQYFRDRAKTQADIELFTKKPIAPARAEILSNPRARSAKLRVVTRRIIS